MVTLGSGGTTQRVCKTRPSSLVRWKSGLFCFITMFYVLPHLLLRLGIATTPCRLVSKRVQRFVSYCGYSLAGLALLNTPVS